MHKNVAAAAFLFYETETFLSVKPLHSAVQFKFLPDYDLMYIIIMLN